MAFNQEAGPNSPARRRGRPPGSKNKKTPLSEAVAARIPSKAPRKRAPQEASRPFLGQKHMALRMDPVAHAILDIHRRRRNVPLAWLVADILHLWIAEATDYDQAIFKELLPPKARAPRVPQRYPGYLESLGFMDTPQAPATSPSFTRTAIPLEAFYSESAIERLARSEYIPTPAPQAAIPAQQNPTPPTPTIPERSLTDLTAPFRHPLTTGPASYPHPEPGLPQGTALFDAAQKPKPGYGNAAQQVTETGRPPDDEPRLAEDVEAFLRHYRVNPEDIR